MRKSSDDEEEGFLPAHKAEARAEDEGEVILWRRGPLRESVETAERIMILTCLAISNDQIEAVTAWVETQAAVVRQITLSTSTTVVASTNGALSLRLLLVRHCVGWCYHAGHSARERGRKDSEFWVRFRLYTL